MSTYKIFYNRDCQMYGVQKYNEQGNFWQQVVPPRNCGARRGQSAYTCYRGVALRWLEELGARA